MPPKYLGMNVNPPAQPVGMLKEIKGSVVEEGWSLPHDVLDKAIDPVLMQASENTAMIRKCHDLLTSGMNSIWGHE
jgi:hypothetical protein